MNSKATHDHHQLRRRRTCLSLRGAIGIALIAVWTAASLTGALLHAKGTRIGIET